jgi:hypothetical protein
MEGGISASGVVMTSRTGVTVDVLVWCMRTEYVGVPEGVCHSHARRDARFALLNSNWQYVRRCLHAEMFCWECGVLLIALLLEVEISGSCRCWLGGPCGTP